MVPFRFGDAVLLDLKRVKGWRFSGMSIMHSMLGPAGEARERIIEAIMGLMRTRSATTELSSVESVLPSRARYLTSKD